MFALSPPLGLLTLLQPIWEVVGRIINSEIAILRSFYMQTGDPIISGREAELVSALDGIQNMLSRLVSMSE
jgi:hypothetical protein